MEKVLVCWSLTSLSHSNGHIETMPAREINPFIAQLIPLLPSFSGHNDRRAIISEWTRLRLRLISHRGWQCGEGKYTITSSFLEESGTVLNHANCWTIFLYFFYLPVQYVLIQITVLPSINLPPRAERGSMADVIYMRLSGGEWKMSSA